MVRGRRLPYGIGPRASGRTGAWSVARPLQAFCPLGPRYAKVSVRFCCRVHQGGAEVPEQSPIAQLAEHSTVNRTVTGSSPVGGASKPPGHRRFFAFVRWSWPACGRPRASAVSSASRIAAWSCSRWRGGAVGRLVGAGRVAVNQITGLDVTDCARDRSARIRLDRDAEGVAVHDVVLRDLTAVPLGGRRPFGPRSGCTVT